MTRGLRSIARDAAVRILYAMGLTRPGRAPEKLTIATFHRVLPERRRAEYPFPGLAVTPEELAWLLEFFRSSFTCTTLAEAVRLHGEGAGDRPLLALTFDDGQLDNFLHARPVLARAGMRATFFVPAAAADRNESLWPDRIGFAVLRGWRDAQAHPRLQALLAGDTPGEPSDRELARRAVARGKTMEPGELADWIHAVEEAAGHPGRPAWDGLMSWSQLRELIGDGHEVGSHSSTHAILPRCNDAALEEETLGSRRLLELRLAARIESFCYPNGDWDLRTVEAVQRAGYRQAVTTRPGTNERGCSPYLLRRCDMVAEHLLDRYGAPSVERLAWRLSGRGVGLA